MDIKKIIKEEINGFDWVNDVNTDEYYLKNPYVGMEYTDAGDDHRVAYKITKIVHDTRYPYMNVTWANGRQDYDDMISHYESRVEEGKLKIAHNDTKIS